LARSEERGKQEVTRKKTSDKIFYGFIDVTKEIIKPKKQQQQSLDLSFHSTGIQFKGNSSQLVQIQNVDNLDRKRSRLDNQIEEVDSCEKIEKKTKSSETRQFGVEIKRKSQPEIIIIKDSENHLEGLKKEPFEDKLNVNNMIRYYC